MIRQAKRLAIKAITPALNIAAKSYVAGPQVEDALRIAKQFNSDGHDVTIGLWDGPDDTPGEIADGYIDGLERLARFDKDAYLSIKLPALDYSVELLDRVVEVSTRLGTRLHFDSLAPDTASHCWAMLREHIANLRNMGCTLPGRWRRSVDDADIAVDLGWYVRVVKGQWADPESPEIDPRPGYLDVIRRLAGRARHVSVATHDVPLAGQALEILHNAGTPCDLELLFGLPSGPSLKAVREKSVSVRFYVPYGTAYLPYVLSKAIKDPHLVWWLLKDAASGAFADLPPRKTKVRR